MNYEQKYLKYKQKYLELKKQIGGNCPVGNYRGQPDSFFTDSTHYKDDECLVNAMAKKLTSTTPETFTKDEIVTYLRALQGFYNKNALCAPDAASGQTKHQCSANLSKFRTWRQHMNAKWPPYFNSLSTILKKESPSFFNATN
jgi:hypothetical protein